MNSLLSGYESLEICTDASLKIIDGRTFTCSGAICCNTQEKRFRILADSTNNKGELVAIHQGVLLAIEEIKKCPGRYARVNLYSDSQFGILGIRDWFQSWYSKMDNDGVIYNASGAPVKNQELFFMVITECIINNMTVNFYNQKGHVDLYSKSSMDEAEQQFKQANGFFIRYDQLYKISYYNNIIDKDSRRLLDSVQASQYPIMDACDNPVHLCEYKVSPNYKNFIK